MGSSAIAIRKESRPSAQLDRHPARGIACVDEGTTDRRDEAAGHGQVLPATSPSQAMPATSDGNQEEEVALHQLWFALPPQQRTQFGGHFSELLLRAVRHQNDLTSIP